MAAVILPRNFYARSAVLVARELLGAVLVRQINGQRVSGRIVETEAYTGLDDQAAHWHRGRTPRSEPLWQSPGHAYVYLVYGLYWLFNAVCEPEDQPAGVLIRALEPLEGQDIIAARRAGVAPRHWTNGPGRLSIALNITGEQHCVDLTTSASDVWIEAGTSVPEEQVRTGPRIGLAKRVQEPWLSIPWRFWIADNFYVSR